MPLISMTGFARAEGSDETQSWVVEVKSVNGKNLDTRVRLPQGYDALEAAIKKHASTVFRRGNIQVGIQLDRVGGESELVVNEAALESAIKIAETVRARIDGPPVRAEHLLGLRAVLELREAVEDEQARTARTAAILATVEAAFSALADMRAGEGAHIENAINQQIDRIADLTNEARDCPDRSPEAVKKRFEDAIARLLETTDQLDPSRLHTEAILLATRADITEELDRLDAHITAARELVNADGPCGRKLDFLAQEFNREANTLCSKAASDRLSHIGLELKTTIDQFREQVQNIE